MYGLFRNVMEKLYTKFKEESKTISFNVYIATASQSNQRRSTGKHNDLKTHLKKISLLVRVPPEMREEVLTCV
jgi:hypothetical protein